MKELKKVYGNFEILKKNGQNNVTKVTYTSLDKYNKSPYLQKITIQSSRKQTIRENTPSRQVSNSPMNSTVNYREQFEEKIKHLKSIQLPKLTTPIKFRQGQVINYFKTQLQSIQNPLSKGKPSIGTHSATLEANKINKLEPLNKQLKLNFAIKTKAGTNGKQAKINQDIAIAEVKLPFGIKVFGVCDGHGINGHHVSAFIKAHFIKNLNSLLKTYPIAPEIVQLKEKVTSVLLKTNQQLLDSQINTELSGSTVLKIISFNIGDSRAILIRQIVNQGEKQETGKDSESQNNHSQSTFIDFKFNNRIVHHEWQNIPLSSDHKPDRPDQRQRIINFGGRIFSQKNQKGQELGPLRVWMKDIAMPGLAMTRSFGDKAGIKAGTNGQPQIKEFDLTPQDKFIIVASDGIWQYLQNDQIMTLMIPFYQRGELQTAADRLVKVSSQIWHKVSFSRDDITVIVISLNTSKP